MTRRSRQAGSTSQTTGMCQAVRGGPLPLQQPVRASSGYLHADTARSPASLGGRRKQLIAAFITGTPGSEAYVAIEYFAGSVDGKSGSFVLQHRGIVNRGDAQLSVTIVPDSGTGELAGISGPLEIDNDEGHHSYVLDYESA